MMPTGPDYDDDPVDAERGFDDEEDKPRRPWIRPLFEDETERWFSEQW